MRRILILYGTTDGQTAKVAEGLAAAVKDEGGEAVMVDASTLSAPSDSPPDSFDGVIVAGSVHAGGFQKAVRGWAKAHAAALAIRPNAFVSVCLAIVKPTPAVEKDLALIVDRFVAATGWRPAQVKFVAGALLYRKYNWLKRLIMRRIVRKAGGETDTSRNYEYTNWDDVRAFGRAFTSQVVRSISAA